MSDAHASQILHLEHSGSAFWVAAIRECFEECGVLFARRNGAHLVSHRSHGSVFAPTWRTALARRHLQFTDFLESERLSLAPDRLLYIGHWITPEAAPRRFSTRFFLGVMPAGQTASVQGDELADGHWVTILEALRLVARGDWRMVVPTITTLRLLAHYPSTLSLWEAVRSQRHRIPITHQMIQYGMQPDPLKWSTS